MNPSKDLKAEIKAADKLVDEFWKNLTPDELFAEDLAIVNRQDLIDLVDEAMSIILRRGK